MKFFSTFVVLGSVLGLTGCVADMDPSSEQGDDAYVDEQTAVAEQEVTNGAINAACAESLTLRNSPGGATIGTMLTGPFHGISKFYVQSTSGSWSYGYSYSLGRWGWAMAFYLTATYSESGTPGQFGYNFSCHRSDGHIIGGGVG
ncbi:hypothetical protein WME91_19245 [Sorangium sp. So ce269]